MSPRRPKWPASVSRPMVSPIHPAVVYSSDGPDMLDEQYEGRVPGYTYAREGHPNADALADMLDTLEGAEGGIVTGSGMAAVTAALLGVMRAGDHVLGGDQLYGRSLRLMNETLPTLGIAASTADPTDAAAVEAAMRPETRIVLIEVVSHTPADSAVWRAQVALQREQVIATMQQQRLEEWITALREAAVIVLSLIHI